MFPNKKITNYYLIFLPKLQPNKIIENLFSLQSFQTEPLLFLYNFFGKLQWPPPRFAFHTTSPLTFLKLQWPLLQCLFFNRRFGWAVVTACSHCHIVCHWPTTTVTGDDYRRHHRHQRQPLSPSPIPSTFNHCCHHHGHYHQHANTQTYISDVNIHRHTNQQTLRIHCKHWMLISFNYENINM